MIRSGRSIIALVLFSFLAMGVGSCANAARTSHSEIAKEFVASLNREDMQALVRLSAKPLLLRQQEWGSAPDGTGFVLGKTRDSNLTSDAQIKQYFSDPDNKIAVESEVPDDASLSLLKDELKGIEKQWSRLSLHLFRRGMEDVEHIFVVGVDAAGKVVAVYLN
jgi:hypothetical protein